MVSERINALNIAKTIVRATGVNSLPSSPESISSGENTMIMIIVPENTGVATSLQALKMTCNLGKF